MLYFENDYSEGAHDKVLEALIKTNYEKLSGYGSDEYCEKAKEKIKKVQKINLTKEKILQRIKQSKFAQMKKTKEDFTKDKN